MLPFFQVHMSKTLMFIITVTCWDISTMFKLVGSHLIVPSGRNIGLLHKSKLNFFVVIHYYIHIFQKTQKGLFDGPYLLIWMNEILVTLKLQPFCMVAPSLVGGPTIRHWSLEVSSGGDSFFCSFRSNELQSMVWSTILVIPPNFFVKPSLYGHPQQAATTYWLLLL